MTRFNRATCALIGMSAALGLSSQPSGAQDEIAEFYRSEPITMIVASGAGGGYDAYARVLARHLPKHVPGEPRMVVQNMPGAAGIVAINHMYNRADRDGSVMAASDSITPFAGLLEMDASKYDPRQFGWIGSIGKQISICIAWHASPFQTVKDVMEKPMRVSGTGATGWRIILPKILNATAKSKLVPIAGYSSAESLLAVERGEVDGACPTYDTLTVTKPHWIEKKLVRTLFHFALEKVAELEGVPSILDYVADPIDRAALELILSQQTTGRPVLAPPGVPIARLRALRSAFAATMKDAELVAEAKRTGLMIDPVEADAMEALIDNAYSRPPAIVERAKALLAQAAKQ